jgi:hypothetical protein
MLPLPLVRDEPNLEELPLDGTVGAAVVMV